MGVECYFHVLRRLSNLDKKPYSQPWVDDDIANAFKDNRHDFNVVMESSSAANSQHVRTIDAGNLMIISRVKIRKLLFRYLCRRYSYRCNPFWYLFPTRLTLAVLICLLGNRPVEEFGYSKIGKDYGNVLYYICDKSPPSSAPCCATYVHNCTEDWPILGRIIIDLWFVLFW